MNKGLFEKRCKYSIRKFSLGVASVMIGATFFGTSPVLADSVQSGSTANLPADLATALATAKENDGRDFEAPKVGEDQGSPEVTDGPKTEEELLALEKEKPLETAKRHQLNSEKYLSYLLECLPNEETLVNKEVLEAYLPWTKVVQEKCK
ncbi:endo-alpha-N-acetylgalactosaminidase [Streptococcus pneumoniae]|nr:endo-alpha-N-acetylgalactosaminidase [Streptococcus pneumoniae]